MTIVCAITALVAGSIVLNSRHNRRLARTTRRSAVAVLAAKGWRA